MYELEVGWWTGGASEILTLVFTDKYKTEHALPDLKVTSPQYMSQVIVYGKSLFLKLQLFADL